MPYPDLGLFLPPEEAYSKPGSYTESLRAEGSQRASYLSSMDQFYAQLEESSRQFDKMLPLRVRELDIAEKGVAVQGQKSVYDYMLGGENIAARERISQSSLAAAERKQTSDAQQSASMLSWLGQMYSGRKQSAYPTLESLYSSPASQGGGGVAPSYLNISSYSAPSYGYEDVFNVPSSGFSDDTDWDYWYNQLMQ